MCIVHEEREKGIFQNKEAITEAVLLAREVLVAHAEDLTLGQYETASFIRRFLRHPVFDTQSKRRGTVVRVSHTGMKVWRIHAASEEEIKWAIL